MSELDIIREQEKMEEVVSLYSRGTRLSDIQKRTGLTRKQITDMLANFREYAKQDPVLRERAKEIVLTVDVHYSDVLNDFYKAIDDADQNGDYKAKMAGLKSVADVQAKRVELLSKAGLVAESALGDQVAEAERKQEVLIGILRDVTGTCKHCKVEVMKRLSKVSGTSERIVVEDD